jgi:hypothetical protein
MPARQAMAATDAHFVFHVRCGGGALAAAAVRLPDASAAAAAAAEAPLSFVRVWPSDHPAAQGVPARTGFAGFIRALLHLPTRDAATHTAPEGHMTSPARAAGELTEEIVAGDSLLLHEPFLGPGGGGGDGGKLRVSVLAAATGRASGHCLRVPPFWLAAAGAAGAGGGGSSGCQRARGRRWPGVAVRCAAVSGDVTQSGHVAAFFAFLAPASKPEGAGGGGDDGWGAWRGPGVLAVWHLERLFSDPPPPIPLSPLSSKIHPRHPPAPSRAYVPRAAVPG